MNAAETDGVMDLARYLAKAPQEPWRIVKIDVFRWLEMRQKPDGRTPLQAFREMRMAYRALPYDNSNDSVNRRIIRDSEQRAWDLDMVYRHGWCLRARLHQNGEREHL